MEKIAIAYIPVLHKGYIDFFRLLEDRGVTDLYLIGDSILKSEAELDYINRKDRLRALSVPHMREAIAAVSDLTVHELTAEDIQKIQDARENIVTPKEDIGKVVVDRFFKDHSVEALPVSLRWNRENVDANKEPEVESLPMSEFQERVVRLMHEEADKSFDWWRQVGAALVQNDEIVYVTHNEHMPEAQTPNIEGDVRSLFKKGIHINYSTAAHAEVVALGSAARNGIKTEGSEIYVTDFPCPYCARLIVSAGIKTVYFLKGYAVLEGDDFLKQYGVKAVRLLE